MDAPPITFGPARFVTDQVVLAVSPYRYAFVGVENRLL